MKEEQDAFLEKLITAMSKITHPRYYESERGYQGALHAELHTLLTEINFEEAIVEQEYQKRIKEHNINIRPDLIIHIPFDSKRHNSRREGNFVVFELKLGSKLNKTNALADYESLAIMCEMLSYPYAIFIIINGDESYLNYYEGPHKDKILVIKVKLVETKVVIELENGL